MPIKTERRHLGNGETAGADENGEKEKKGGKGGSRKKGREGTGARAGAEGDGPTWRRVGGCFSDPDNSDGVVRTLFHGEYLTRRS